MAPESCEEKFWALSTLWQTFFNERLNSVQRKGVEAVTKINPCVWSVLPFWWRED